MKICICVLILFQLLTCSVYSQCYNNTNIYSFVYSGKTYQIVKETKTWAEASACAVENGGYLVEIGSLAEQIAIYNGIVASGIPNDYKPVSDGGGTSYIWIGATDKNIEGTWLWNGDNNNFGIHFWTGQGVAGANNGSPVDGLYNNWGGASSGIVKEPDDYASNQDAAAIGLTGWPFGTTNYGIAGEWNNINIDNSIYYIIKYDHIHGGINEIGANEDLCTISPNPCKDKLSLKNKIDFENLKIYDCNGIMVYKNDFKLSINPIIDVSYLKQGIYILLIEYKEQNYQTIKFVKE